MTSLESDLISQLQTKLETLALLIGDARRLRDRDLCEELTITLVELADQLARLRLKVAK